MNKIKHPNDYPLVYFAYMDILGYSDMVTGDMDEQQSFERIRKLEELVQLSISQVYFLNKMNEEGNGLNVLFEYEIFSDSLCLWCNLETGENNENDSNAYLLSQKYKESNYSKLWLLMMLVTDIQMEAIRYGFVFRGAISCGNHYKSKNVMYSKALVYAYKAESHIAVFPRIILCNNPECGSLQADSLISGLIHDGWILKDGEIYFVDYMVRLLGMRHINPEYAKELLQIHKALITQRLEKYADNSQVKRKYQWLAEYHNYKTKSYDKDLLIDIQWDPISHIPELKTKTRITKKEMSKGVLIRIDSFSDFSE